MRRHWWKVVCVLLLAYTVAAELLIPVPRRHILNETIRNLYFHVPMWFTMIVLFGVSFVALLAVARLLAAGQRLSRRIALGTPAEAR